MVPGKRGCSLLRQLTSQPANRTGSRSGRPQIITRVHRRSHREILAPALPRDDPSCFSRALRRSFLDLSPRWWKRGPRCREDAHHVAWRATYIYQETWFWKIPKADTSKNHGSKHLHILIGYYKVINLNGKGINTIPFVSMLPVTRRAIKNNEVSV